MSAMTTATITRNDFTIEPFPAYAYASEPTSSTATPSDTDHRQRWSSPSEVSSLHSFPSSRPEHDRPVSPPAATSGPHPPALGHVAERPVAIPQQRPTPTAPFYPAYAPSLRNHGITPAAWRKFVANMNEAILTTSSVSDHTRSITRRIRAASGGMWSAIVSSSASLVPGSKDNSNKNTDNAANNDESGAANGTGASSTGRTSPPTPTSPTTSGPCRTLREERVIACIAAANIAWFHPQGLHVAMVDTTVLAGRLVGAGSGDVRGILPSRLVEAARPRRDEGPAAQLAALRPWIAELEVDRPESGGSGSAYAAKPLLDLAPYSLWIVVTRRTEGDIAAGY
ncbi:hypothetical protein PG997_014080 [Apiospora hydei]|uniref:Uncharacterized protein n=1 Tax=Apiospora hydei TaxID=1337664 RepID=A0ABR1V816_9PEZI